MDTKSVVKTGNGTLHTLFDRHNLLDKFFGAPLLDEYFTLGKVTNVPSVNVSETNDTYLLTIATPGLEKNDINVEVADGMLTISAETEEKKTGRYNRREYNYCSWSRSFSLPQNCEESKVSAEYKNGELKISIPKNDSAKTKSKKSIAIK